MPEGLPPRLHALGKHYVPGRFGKQAGEPGVKLSLVHPVSVVSFIARAGSAMALSSAMEKAFGAALPGPGLSAAGKQVGFHAAGAEQWFAIASGMKEGALMAALVKAGTGLGSFSDQSHARLLIEAQGPSARKLLSKGTPVDLHPRHFPANGSALTQMAHVGVHLTAHGPDSFRLSVFRGFGESFWEWLTSQAAEFGYEVKAI